MKHFLLLHTYSPMTDGIEVLDTFDVELYMITNPKWNAALNDTKRREACREYLDRWFAAPVSELYQVKGSSCWRFNVVQL